MHENLMRMRKLASFVPANPSNLLLTLSMSVFDRLPPAGKRLSRIPRFGRLIGRMDDAQLDRLDSNAAVYWEVLTYVSLRNSETTGLLDTGLIGDEAKLLGWHDDPDQLDRSSIRIRRWQVRLALGFLSAVAFQMMCGTDENGKPSPKDRIENDDVEPFEDAVRDSMFASGTYVDENDDPLSKRMWSRDWECIKKLNAGLDYNVFSDCESRILFTDNNLRDFLAAHWAVRWASADEQRVTQNWLPYCLDNKDDYTEFWNRVIELRELPINAKQKLVPLKFDTWESLIAPIYDIQLQAIPNQPIRSTELMYRTWGRMEGHPAKQSFHNEFKQLVAQSEIARRLIQRDDGTSQFVKLADPNDPRDKEQFSQSKSGRLMAEFRMGSIEEDTGAYEDEKPERKVLLSPFAVHRYCITNAQYELFDPLHLQKREFAEKVDSVDQHPVVNVNWFDGWCFANWIGQIDIGGEAHHVQCPSEAQWEYACRCGRSTSYTWEGGSDGDQIDPSKAWYGWFKDQRPEKERTIAVNGDDASLQMSIAANPWGLHQMHGNVWEWCEDWYSRYEPEDAYDPKGSVTGSTRVLRGGSWFNSGWVLRSAYRLRYSPSLRCRFSGFRLAAVPLSPASQVRASKAEARQAE